MALTVTAAQLAAAIRVGDSTEEVAEVERLLAYATEAVTKHAPGAPDVAHNEAVVRLAGYLFDQPVAARGQAYANAMRNSGAGRLLLPYVVHGAGSTAEAVAAAQAAMGSTDNPVTDIVVSGSTLTVHFEDGTTRDETLPAAGMTGDGTDQTARDAAAAAQSAADAAQSDIDAHEASPHNMDITAQSVAFNARQTAEQAQTAVETHRNSTHNTDTTARDAAAAAQSDADTAQTTAGQAQATATAASTAANAAQADIDDHEANHPTGMGGGPTVLYEAATAAIGGSTGLIAGNVVCPETGELEFYFEGLSGSRQGGVAYARIPVARIRGAVSALTVAYNNDNENVLVIAHGANRGIGGSGASGHVLHDAERTSAG